MRYHSRVLLISLTLGCLSFSPRLAVGQSAPQNTPGDDHRVRILREIEQQKQKILASPNDAMAYEKLGILYQSMSNWQEAAAAYEHATQAADRFATAYYALGWCYGNMAKYEDALKAHQQALLFAGGEKFKLEKAAAQYALGWDYYELKQYPEAIAAYLRALELNPKYQVALYEIGRVYLASEEREKVLQIAARLDTQFKQLLLKELELTVPLRPLTPLEKPLAPNQTTALSTPAPRIITDSAPQVSPTMRPTITVREKAHYTEIARQNKIQGTVMLSIVFAADGTLNRVRVLRPLPFGLTGQALLALEKIRFNPATKDGQPVSVRGNIEYGFSLY